MNKPPTQLRPDLVYLRSEVEAADPLRLLLMLYNKFIRELREIRGQLDAQADTDVGYTLPVETAEKFERCRTILSYLIDSLDPKGGELSERLTSLYLYVYQKIISAQTEKDGRIIDEILSNVETLREGWVGIANGKADI